MTMSLPLFDATKYFGAGSSERPEYPTAAVLLAEMDRLGIGRALAWHVQARDLYPPLGNRALVEEIAATPGAAGRLIPAFTIAPTLQYETGAMAELRRTMTAHGVRALRVFRERWPLTLLEPVVRAVGDLHPVVVINVREGLDVREIRAFCAALPEVPLVALHGMWPHQPALFDLLQHCPNVRIDTSWMHTAGTIEMVVQRFGAERLLFGTGGRAMNGAGVAALAQAEVTDAVRAQIGDGNLAALLDVPAGTAAPAPPQPRYRTLLRGEPLPDEIIDAHGHLGVLGMWVLESNDFDVQATRYLRTMDRLGVRLALVSGEEALFTEPLAGNAYLRERCRPYGDRFRGYYGFNPHFADTLTPRLDEFFQDPFFVGFKLLCDYWRVPVTDPRFTPVWDYANAHHLPLLLHTWNGPYDDPAMLAEIAPAYPQASFLLGHSGGSDRRSAEALAQANPNVYLEWCGSFCTPQRWEETLARVDPRQVVYGSDGIFHDPAWELGRLLSVDVPDDVLRPILGATMREILGRRR